MKRPVLLDSSFLIDLERETARGELGPAGAMLHTLRGRRVAISVVSVEEVLEGAADHHAAALALSRFSIQGLHMAQARRCALLQRKAAKRLGENDAWLVATADALDAEIVAADRPAFARLGDRYRRFK